MHGLPQRSSLVAQTAAILGDRIQAGEWRKWLPGEHELCAQLRVSRMTLRRALQQLQRAGLVRSSQGKPREIVIRRRAPAPRLSGRVVLLTQVPMHFRLPLDAFWVNELRKVLAEAGYHLEVLANRALYGRGFATGLARLREQLQPAGWVLTNSTREMQRWFSRRRLPCIIVGSRHPGVELPFVDKAFRAICRHAAGVFLARGHRRLALLNPASGFAGDLESEEGFREGAAQTHRADIQARVVRHDDTVANICRQLDEMMRRPDAPTALLVSRAAYVLTVMGHLMRRGLRLPQDVALIARDHEPFLDSMVPSVARYVQSSQIMAHRICSAVLELLENGLVSPANCLIMPEFKTGETLGPMPPRPPPAGTSGSPCP